MTNTKQDNTASIPRFESRDQLEVAHTWDLSSMWADDDAFEVMTGFQLRDRTAEQFRPLFGGKAPDIEKSL